MKFIRHILQCPKCVESSLSARLYASLPSHEPEELGMYLQIRDGEKVPKKLTPSERLWVDERERFNKSYANKQVHVTSINRNTDERSIVRLSLPSEVKKLPTFIRQSNLPSESLAGLKSSIADCKYHPKVVQNNADVLGRALDSRRFPASSAEIREARREVMAEIRETDVDIMSHLQNPKSKELIEKLIYKKAQKKLSQRRYNWTPLDIKTREQAAAFALSKLSPYFAEMERVLLEFDRNNFVPETILDFGSGIGSAFWASHARWGEKIKHYCLVDGNYNMRNFSMDIMRGQNYSGSGEFVNKSVYFRKNLVQSPTNTYDLVILHRTLVEMPSDEDRKNLIDTLWRRTNRYMIIVESPLSESFKALMKIRDHIITAGYQFDFDAAKEALDLEGKLDMELIHFFANKKITDYEKFRVVQEKLPNYKITTRLDPGFVFAPCPHDQACPRMDRSLGFVDSCKFKVRWTEVRADHKTQSYKKDGTLTGKFSYVIFEKGERPAADSVGMEPRPRILEKSKGHGCSTCKLCTPNDGIQMLTISKRAKPIYQLMVASEASQLLPVDYRLVKRGSDTDVSVKQLEEDTVAKNCKVIDIGSSTEINSSIIDSGKQ